MSARAFSSLERICQVRRVQRLSLLSVGSVFAALSINHYRLEAQRAKVNRVVQQALDLCSAFGKQCEIEGEPRFCRENVPLPSVKQMERPLWFVPVHTDGQHYAMILRADTGKLCSVFNISLAYGKVEQTVSNAPRPDANRAVTESLLYLQRLKVIPGDAQIALDSPPESVRSNIGWRVDWNVCASQNAPAEAVRVTVSQQDGRLLQFTNTAALNQVAR